MAAEALRVLFVEDSPEDVEFETRALRKGGLSIQVLRVETPDALVRALAEFKPDLILSDYSLPLMDGMAALKIAKETCPEIPLIFVSGTIGEERAIESLKQGATDYLVKDRLGGLVAKVERALAEARERRERRLSDERLRQAQKMEAVGRLAGGIAHDFNNLLTAIMGYTELVLARLGADSAARPDLDEVLKASSRAASLTRQLLAFSRKQILRPQVLDLNAIVSDMDKMLRRVLSESVDLVSTLDPGLGRVKADPGQIEQIILNLAINARDAMPEGGTLTIETANLEGDELLRTQPERAGSGPQVRLTVRDTGSGMSDDVKAHLFEPFFTTKEPGKGTGLGLSTVFGIVSQSAGSISVSSELGQGTTFRILFPRIEEPLEPQEPPPGSSEALSGTETILLVEDADAVRNLVRSVLEARGYTLLEAPDGRSALDLCAGRTEPLHLLLSDLVLPKMNGRALAQALASIHPELRVLFMSGYSEDPAAQKGEPSPGTYFLAKPFTSDELARRVRQVLDGRP